MFRKQSKSADTRSLRKLQFRCRFKGLTKLHLALMLRVQNNKFLLFWLTTALFNVLCANTHEASGSNAVATFPQEVPKSPLRSADPARLSNRGTTESPPTLAHSIGTSG